MPMSAPARPRRPCAAAMMPPATLPVTLPRTPLAPTPLAPAPAPLRPHRWWPARVGGRMASRRYARRGGSIVIAHLLVGPLVAGLVAGCGVSESGPVDVGDAAVAAIFASGGIVRTPPTAESATTPNDLVNNF